MRAVLLLPAPRPRARTPGSHVELLPCMSLARPACLFVCLPANISRYRGVGLCFSWQGYAQCSGALFQKGSHSLKAFPRGSQRGFTGSESFCLSNRCSSPAACPMHLPLGCPPGMGQQKVSTFHV